MALSTYFNWDTLQTPNSEINTFHEPTQELALDNYHNNHNIFNYSDESFFLSNTLFDPYFDPTLFSIPEFYPPHQQLLSCPSSYDPFISLTHEDYYNFSCPKRQKCFFHEEQELVDPSLQEELIIPSNFLVPNYHHPCSLQEEELQELLYAVPEFKVPELPQGTCCVGSADFQCEKKSTNNERTISAQSIAARERRRKITEKTQELGKLVPGGPKMNTAEMLHAAAKYVKCLQAQVGMLELMKTLNGDKKGPGSEELHTMVVSPFVQEKLYSEEMCFVPKELVTTLTIHNDVQSRPSILQDLKQLIGTDIEKKPKQE